MYGYRPVLREEARRAREARRESAGLARRAEREFRRLERELLREIRRLSRRLRGRGRRADPGATATGPAARGLPPRSGTENELPLRGIRKA